MKLNKNIILNLIFVFFLSGCSISINKHARILPTTIGSSLISAGIVSTIVGISSASYAYSALNIKECPNGDLIGPCRYNVDTLTTIGFTAGLSFGFTGLTIILMEHLSYQKLMPN